MGCERGEHGVRGPGVWLPLPSFGRPYCRTVSILLRASLNHHLGQSGESCQGRAPVAAAEQYARVRAIPILCHKRPMILSRTCCGSFRCSNASSETTSYRGCLEVSPTRTLVAGKFRPCRSTLPGKVRAISPSRVMIAWLRSRLAPSHFCANNHYSPNPWRLSRWQPFEPPTVQHRQSLIYRQGNAPAAVRTRCATVSV